jgi:hypothetical protein
MDNSESNIDLTQILAALQHLQQENAVLKNSVDRLQTSGELQDKTSSIDPSIGVDLLKGCSPYYLLL